MAHLHAKMCCQVFHQNTVVKSMVIEPHRKFIGHMLGTPFGAVESYISLLENNSSLLRSNIDGLDHDVKAIVQWMRQVHQEDKNGVKQLNGAPFITLLNSLIQFEGIPLPKNQNWWVNTVEATGTNDIGGSVLKHFSQAITTFFRWLILLVQVTEEAGLLIPLSAQQDNSQVFLTFSNNTQNVHELMQDFDDSLGSRILEASPQQKIAQFHIETIKLFANLCKNRNRNVTDHIFDNIESLGFKYPLLIRIISDETLPGICALL